MYQLFMYNKEQLPVGKYSGQVSQHTNFMLIITIQSRQFYLIEEQTGLQSEEAACLFSEQVSCRSRNIVQQFSGQKTQLSFTIPYSSQHATTDINYACSIALALIIFLRQMHKRINTWNIRGRNLSSLKVVSQLLPSSQHFNSLLFTWLLHSIYHHLTHWKIHTVPLLVYISLHCKGPADPNLFFLLFFFYFQILRTQESDLCVVVLSEIIVK